MVAVVYTTIDNLQTAKHIAHKLAEEKLVACVNIIPKIESVYRWKEKIEEDKECIMLVKTIDKKIKATIRRIRELHSYELPDIVVLPIIGGLKDYLSYISDETA